MRLTRTVLAALAVTLACNAGICQAKPEKPDVGKAVVLPVELKEPFTAYTLGLVPFYSMSAANYVGTTRLRWEPADEIRGSASNQYLADWGLLASAAVLSGAGAASQNPMLSLTSLVAIVAIPLSHMWFYAPFWGNKAVEFNRTQMTDNGFTPAE